MLANFGSESPSNLQISTNQSVETVEYFRAKEITLIDRGVIRNEISFSVARIHSTVLDAKKFILDHAMECVGVKMLTIDCRGTGGVITKRYIRQAMVTPTGSHTGCSSLFQYKILGGKLTDVLPT